MYMHTQTFLFCQLRGQKSDIAIVMLRYPDLGCVCVCVCVLVALSCLTLCDPTDHNHQEGGGPQR